MNHLERLFASLPLNYQSGVGENEINANLRGHTGLWKETREGGPWFLFIYSSDVSKDVGGLCCCLLKR